MKWLHGFLLLASLMSYSLKTHGQGLPIAPDRDWRVLETKHFEIIYDAQDKQLAELYAQEAERAEALLQPLLKTPMPEKVPIVIADITDNSNGSATGLPRSTIIIYPVMPSVSEPTGEYYEWAREVVTHEYTHILNFEPTSGFMKVLRIIYGNLIKPGMYMPRWYTEGLAVEMESILTPIGRGRSHYYSAFTRAQIEGGRWGLETIDRINSTGIPSWPRGQRPYTYGYFLLHEMQNWPDNSARGKDTIYSVLNERYGGRFPWFINGPVEDYFGTDYQGLLSKMYINVEERASKQLQKLKNGGAQNGQTHPLSSSYFVSGAQISPDGHKMAAIVSSYDSDPEIRLWRRKNISEPFNISDETGETITSGKEIHQITWRKDSKTLIYDATDTWRHFYQYSDLYSVDIADQEPQQLTYGLRAREATVLPDESLVFVVTTSHNTKLMMRTSDEKVHNILSPPFGERLSSPRSYKEGVIYSRRNQKGQEWIEYFSLKTKSTERLTKISERPGQQHTMPNPSKNESGHFFYSASDSGVINIYESDGRKSWPVTNVTTYAASPTYDGHTNTLYYSRLTTQGFELTSSKKTTTTPASISSLQNYSEAQEFAAPKTKIEDEYGYNGLRYLFPQYWIPFVYFVPDGALLSASFSGSDPLEHHNYSLGVGYDTRAKQPTEELIYTNATFPFFIDVVAANQYVYLVGLSQTERITQATIDTRHFLLPNSNKWMIGPAITYRQTDYPGFLFTEFGPGAMLSYKNISAAKDFQISPESGESLNLGYFYYLPSWGNTSYQVIYGDGSIYLSGWILPKHNVIMLKTSAWVAPPQNSIFTGTQQAGGEVQGSLLAQPYVVRGYPVGEFIGSTIFTGQFEYRFPLGYPFSGWGTAPIFFNKYSAALFADAVTLHGGYYDNELASITRFRAARLGTFFMGAGGELRAETTLFYGFPLMLRMGLYYGFNQYAFGGSSIFLGLGGAY